MPARSPISAEPRVAVIIPAWNTAPYIAETLDSVFAQTYRNLEPVVVNDGSPDTPELERVLAPYMDRIRYIVRPNGGLAAARNTGIRAVTTELIALLDSDDIWEPDCLATQVSFLVDNPEYDLAYGDIVMMGGPLSGKRFMELWPSTGEVTFEALVRRTCNVTVSVLAKREGIVAAGCFDEGLRRCEDFDMWGRFLKAGYRIGYHRRLVMRYRRHDANLSGDTVAMVRTILSVYEKFARMELTAAEHAAVREQIERCRAEILFHEGKDAFVGRDFEEAASKLLAANTLLREWRLWLIAHLIRLCPRLLHQAYMMRHPQAR